MKNIFSDTKCKYESYDKNEIDSLLDNKSNTSDVYVKGDFAVIKGEFDVAAATTSGQFAETAIEINYPTGFTKSNCTCISFGTGRDRSGRTDEYVYDGSQNVSGLALGFMNGNLPKSLALNNDKLRLIVENGATNSNHLKYKIVLMKIS